MSETMDDKWFPGPRSAVGARLRLFCFPHSGASFTTFSHWQAELTSQVDVRPVEFPGRISRLREPAFRDLNALVDTLMRVMAPHLQQPFALFGYSMGALVAFELARRLAKDGQRAPNHLFVAARPAPHLPKHTQQLSHLPDAAFLEEVARRYRPIPENVLRDASLRKGLLNMMRADLEMVESYSFQAGRPLRCPITALGGQADPLVTQDALISWSPHTSAEFSLETFEGDHFFLETHRTALLHAIRRKLIPASSDKPREMLR